MVKFYILSMQLLSEGESKLIYHTCLNPNIPGIIFRKKNYIFLSYINKNICFKNIFFVFHLNKNNETEINLVIRWQELSLLY